MQAKIRQVAFPLTSFCTQMNHVLVCSQRHDATEDLAQTDIICYPWREGTVTVNKWRAKIQLSKGQH